MERQWRWQELFGRGELRRVPCMIAIFSVDDAADDVERTAYVVDSHLCHASCWTRNSQFEANASRANSFGFIFRLARRKSPLKVSVSCFAAVMKTAAAAVEAAAAACQ